MFSKYMYLTLWLFGRRFKYNVMLPFASDVDHGREPVTVWLLALWPRFCIGFKYTVFLNLLLCGRGFKSVSLLSYKRGRGLGFLVLIFLVLVFLVCGSVFMKGKSVVPGGMIYPRT